MLRRFVGATGGGGTTVAGERPSQGARARLGALFGRGGSFDEDDDASSSVDSGGGSSSDGEYDEETVMEDITVASPAAPESPTPATKTVTSTQVFCSPAVGDPIETLQTAQADITALSIFMKDLQVNQSIAANFVQLIRGDNRSWEAIAVDILRQKARWESITFEACKNPASTAAAFETNEEETQQEPKNDTTSTAVVNYMDVCISFVLTLDNCAFLHLSNLLLTEQLSKSFTALAFAKSIQKLQFDLIDLSSCIHLLAEAMQANTSLTCLIASLCGLQDKVLQTLIQAIPIQLQELRLFGNMCRHLGLEALANALYHSRHLEILDVSFQHVPDMNNGDEEDEGSGQPDSEKAKKRDSFISPSPAAASSDPFNIEFLAAALRKNTTLKVLDLDNDNLNDTHLAHLVSALEENETLEELTLNHNKISGAGVALMASKFHAMKGLKKISMYSNAFD